MGILIYSGTVILSTTLQIISKLFLLKKLANTGYKFDDFKLFFTKTNLLLFIPIVNFSLFLNNIIQYLEIQNFSAKQLFLEKGIVPLTKEEKQFYNFSFGLLNSLKLNLQNLAKPNMILIYTNDNCENIIYFTIERNINIIIYAKGPISKLPKKIQYEQLNENLNKICFDDNLQNTPDSKKEIHQKKYNSNIFNPLVNIPK